MLVTMNNYASVMERLAKAEFLFNDTETSGLHPWGNRPGGDFHRRWGIANGGDRLCGISTKAPGAPQYAGESDVTAGRASRVGEVMNAYYLPFRHINPADNLPLEYIKRDFAPLLRRIRSGGFNYGFDLQSMLQDGVPTPEDFEEVSTMAHLLNENEPSLKLKQLAKRYVRPDAADEEEVLKERLVGAGLGKGNMWKLAAAEVEPYACDDVVLTEGLRDFCVPHLQTWKLHDLWKELNDYAAAILAMEVEGVCLDVPLIDQYMAEAEVEAKQSLAVLRQLTGDDTITVGCHKRFQRWLKMPSVAREVLEDIIEQPGVTELLMARGWDKVNGTYYLVFKRLMDELSRLHANLNIIGTETGRLSGSKPPLHAIPRMRAVADRLARVYKVKDVFVADSDEDDLGEADYSQAELRVGSHCAQERNMAAVYLREAATGIDADLHGDTARDLNVDRDSVAKRLNLSCQYLIGAKSFSKKYHMPLHMSRDYIERWHKRYPGYRRLFNKAQEVAEKRGYIRMFTGRVRHYNTPHSESRKASSNLIQGDVAEMIRIAITRIHKELRGYVRMKLTVHDSILFGCKRTRTREVVPEIVRIMKDTPWCSVPQKIDVKVGRPGARARWGKLEKFQKVFPKEDVHAA